MNHTLVSNKILFSTLTKRGLINLQYEVCESCTGRHIDSLSDLSDNEVALIVKDLGSDELYGRADFTNARHRYILSMCYQLGWTRMHERLGRMVADNARLGRWIKQYGKYKKPLKEYTPEELGAVIMAMEKMLNNRMK